jgi:hypothetical protein
MYSNPRQRTNAYDIRRIPGYPDKLKLYRIPASRFWQVSMYVKGGPSSGIKKSTRCEKFNEAVEFAKEWYEDRILEQRAFRIRGTEDFSAFAEKLQATQKRQIARGDLDRLMLLQDSGKLEKDLIPRIGDIHISKVDYNLVDDLVEELRQERNLSSSTLKKYVVLIRKVLKEANRDGVIDFIPALPSIRSQSTPRPWFAPEEYKRLLAACRDLRDNPPEDLKFDFGEMYDFIVFMIHTFLRPSEWKFLQNKHVRTIEADDGIQQLVLSVPNAKTKKAKGLSDSTSTEIAAAIYHKNILPRHSGKDDYLFFNDIQDRTSYVSDRVSRMFRLVCEKADLAEDRYGQKHTMYSLRHSALCFHILNNGGSDLFALAQNARTSTDMLEKFYLSHLRPQIPVFARQLRTAWALTD